MDWRERDGVRWLEAEMPGVVAAFSTRLGGASAGSYESLNLGLLTGDDPARVAENRARLAAAVGRDPDGILIGHQVHANGVLERDAAPSPNPYLDFSARPPEADGQLTSNSALTPLVQVADCLPVALAARRAVAMLHCGWRGLAAGIVARGVAATGARAAAIGPGIGPCCYEVGDEVRERFGSLGDGVTRGRNLDLTAVARAQLEAAGVAEVDAAGVCTHCNPDLFFSHRRDGGSAGRQAGLAWRRP